LGATKQLENEGTVHLERSSIGSSEHACGQVGLAEGLRKVPPKGQGHAQAHARLGSRLGQPGALRRRNGRLEEADRTLDISELARGEPEGPLRRRYPRRVRRRPGVFKAGGRHLSRPVGIRLDQAQGFGGVRGFFGTGHLDLPVALSGAKS
jgi:hypothetical protein